MIEEIEKNKENERHSEEGKKKFNNQEQRGERPLSGNHLRDRVLKCQKKSPTAFLIGFIY